MNICDLRNRIKKSITAGNQPFLVSATSGTTVLGAFDDLWEIANVCKEFGLWFHVDVNMNTFYYIIQVEIVF